MDKLILLERKMLPGHLQRFDRKNITHDKYLNSKCISYYHERVRFIFQDDSNSMACLYKNRHSPFWEIIYFVVTQCGTLQIL